MRIENAIGTMKRSGWLILAIALCLPGCKKFKEQIATQQDEIAKLSLDMAELQQQKGDLENGLEESQASLEARIAEFEARIASMSEYQKALEDQLKSLGVDKGKMADQYKKAQENLANQQKLIDEMRRKQAQAQKRLNTLKDMLLKFKSLIEGGKLKVRIRNGKLMLELPSAILFDSGKAALSDDGKTTLSEVATVLKRIRKREFQVAGHTDNVPITSGKFPSNWELSTARAVSVVKFLQEQGMNPKSLSAAGYSEYMPTARNDSTEGKAKNRRIEIILMPNLDELPDLSSLEKQIDK